MASNNSSGSKDKNNNIKMIEKSAKTYKWCWKCSGKLEEGSNVPFCCFECQSEYMLEIKQDIDDIISDLI